MAFADSNRASLRYLLEDPNGFAITPASGSPREMRITTSNLAYDKATETSQELRSDRMVSSIVEVGASTAGDIEFEFSAGAIDDFIAAFLYGAWSRPMTMLREKGVGVSITANNTITIANKNVAHEWTVGRVIKTEGFALLDNNRYATIATVTYSAPNTVITVSGTPFAVEAGSVTTRLLDANDVIVQSTAIRLGTAGAATIDSNSGNAFTAAVAAGQIKVGQKVFLDGLGYGVGSVVFGSVPAAGTRVVLFDGDQRQVFQFGGSLPPGYINVAIGVDADACALNLRNAIIAAYVADLIDVHAFIDVGVTDDTVTLTNLRGAGGSIAEELDTGTALTVTDFTGGSNSKRGFFTVTSAGNDVIGLSPAPSTDANAGAAMVILKSSCIRNPSRVQDFIRQSFTIETSFEDVQQHFIAKGLRVGQFSLTIEADSLLNGTLSFQGTEMLRRVDQTSLLLASPYTPAQAPNFEVMSATANVGSLTKNGTALATSLMSIEINGEANLRDQRAVGSKFAKGIGVGRFEITGTINAYFESGEMFDHFTRHDTISLGFSMTDQDKNVYDWLLPAIKLTSNPVAPGSIDEDVMEELEFEALRDPATACMFQLCRFSSTRAPSAI